VFIATSFPCRSGAPSVRRPLSPFSAAALTPLRQRMIKILFLRNYKIFIGSLLPFPSSGPFAFWIVRGAIDRSVVLLFRRPKFLFSFFGVFPPDKDHRVCFFFKWRKCRPPSRTPFFETPPGQTFQSGRMVRSFHYIAGTGSLPHFFFLVALIV